MNEVFHNVQAPDIEQRPPIGYANYTGNVVPDVTRRIDEGIPSGPNYMGELMWPVEATFGPDTGRTRVGFSLIPSPVALARIGGAS